LRKLKSKLGKGFTLIELMIVVAIIGILAAIAIPNFIRYQLKSKTSEARTNLGGIKTNQESFKATEDGYAVSAGQPNTAGQPTKLPWGAMACPAGCDRTNPGACTEFDCIGFRPAGDVYYGYNANRRAAAAGTTAEFCAGAQSDLDGDGMAGGFALASLNDTNTTAPPVGPDMCTGGCPAVVLPWEVVDCMQGIY
jgi:type IV pilus assembly protein PilA